MKNLIILVVFLSALGSLIAQQPQPSSGNITPFVFDPPCIANCNDPIMFSQVNGLGFSTPSQIFSDFPTFLVEVADDFELAEAGTISSVDFSGIASGNTALGTRYVFRVYDDNGGLPGNQVYSEDFIPATVDPDGDGTFSIVPTASPVLQPGTYWISVQLDCAFATCGQFFWNTSTDDLTGNPWVIRNPGDGYLNGCTDWASGAACGFGGLYGPGLLFGIAICPTQTPTSPIPTMSQWAMLLFGLIVVTLGVVTIYNKSKKLA